MFGFIGMVAFVPLFAAMYALFSDFLKERLNKKGLPEQSLIHLTVIVPPSQFEKAYFSNERSSSIPLKASVL